MAHPFFNATYYLARNPDVAAFGYTLATAELHYDRYGAAEGRAPNIWFNATAYLSAYPDLVAHGVTAATAFLHYINYGINEGRWPAPNLDPARFSYTDYANANADLRTAFGIADAAHLTTDQQHQLFGHFLSYGYLENRPGIVSTDANSFYAAFGQIPGQGSSTPPPPADDHGTVVDGSHASKIYIGGAGPDIFTGMQVHLNGTTLQGQASGDSLIAAALTGSLQITLNSIETIQADLAGDSSLVVADTTIIAGLESGLATIALKSNSHAFTYGGAPVGAFVLNDNANLTYHTAALAGLNDTLALSLAGGATSTVLVDGVGGAIEHYKVTYAGAGNLTLSPRNVDGGVLNVDLLGGAAGSADSLTLSGGTAAIQTIIVDGSAAAGNQTIVIGSSFSAANATLTGGSGDDTLSDVADVGHSATVNGGAGADTLVASMNHIGSVTLDSVEKIILKATADNSGLIVAGAGVTAVEVRGDSIGGDSWNIGYTGAKVDTFSFVSDSHVTANFNAGVGGLADTLDLKMADAVTFFTTTGIEQYNVTMGATTQLKLDVGTVTGTALNIVLDGGSNTGHSYINLSSSAVGGVQTVTVDGSAVAGDQGLSVEGALSAVDSVLIGGAGNDSLTLVGHNDAARDATMNGGAGNDYMEATPGIDTLTGGAGNDTFDYFLNRSGLVRMNGAGKISQTDVITDFQAGDILKFTTGTIDAGALGTIGTVNANGVLAFNAAFLLPGPDLTDVVTAINTQSGAANSNILFQFGADSYFLNSGNGAVANKLIKLAGVTDVTKLVTDLAGAHYLP